MHFGTARGHAALLIAGGYIPFAALALTTVAMPDFPLGTDRLHLALVGYGAVILSFLGGIRWGMAIAADDRASAGRLVLSVLPSLLGWLALFLQFKAALGLLVAGFALQYLWDRSSAATGAMPDWFARQRLFITLAVIAALGFAALLG